MFILLILKLNICIFNGLMNKIDLRKESKKEVIYFLDFFFFYFMLYSSRKNVYVVVVRIRVIQVRQMNQNGRFKLLLVNIIFLFSFWRIQLFFEMLYFVELFLLFLFMIVELVCFFCFILFFLKVIIINKIGGVVIMILIIEIYNVDNENLINFNFI